MSAAMVKIGSHWRDKDPRKYGRVVEVLETDSRYAYCVTVVGTQANHSRILLSNLVRRFEEVHQQHPGGEEVG